MGETVEGESARQGRECWEGDNARRGRECWEGKTRGRGWQTDAELIEGWMPGKAEALVHISQQVLDFLIDQAASPADLLNIVSAFVFQCLCKSKSLRGIEGTKTNDSEHFH